MKTRTLLTSLALCCASALTFAATPPAHPSNPSPSTAATTSNANGTHCAKGYVLQHGKCVAKDKNKPVN